LISQAVVSAGSWPPSTGTLVRKQYGD